MSCTSFRSTPRYWRTLASGASIVPASVQSRAESPKCQFALLSLRFISAGDSLPPVLHPGAVGARLRFQRRLEEGRVGAEDDVRGRVGDLYLCGAV